MIVLIFWNSYTVVMFMLSRRQLNIVSEIYTLLCLPTVVSILVCICPRNLVLIRLINALLCSSIKHEVSNSWNNYYGHLYREIYFLSKNSVIHSFKMIFGLFQNITLSWCYECPILKVISSLQWLSQWDRLSPRNHDQLKKQLSLSLARNKGRRWTISNLIFSTQSLF